MSWMPLLLSHAASACLKANSSVGFPGTPKAATACKVLRMSSSVFGKSTKVRKSFVETFSLSSIAPAAVTLFSSLMSSMVPMGTSKYDTSRIHCSSSLSVPFGVWNFSR